MKDFWSSAAQLVRSGLAAIGMIPIGIIYLLGYAIGMRLPAGAGGTIGMMIAPILGLAILVFFGIWLS